MTQGRSGEFQIVFRADGRDLGHVLRDPVLPFGHFGEEPVKSPRRHDRHHPGGHFADDAEGMLAALLDEHHLTRTVLSGAALQPELDLAGEHVEGFILGLVDVTRRTKAGLVEAFKDAEAPAGLGGGEQGLVSGSQPFDRVRDGPQFHGVILLRKAMIRRREEFVKQIFWIVYIYTMNLRGFDLNLLRVLNALLAEQSTVKAAKQVGLSQSAVSAALGRLRGALEDPLFVRHGQRIVPTDFARSLEVPLKAILDDLERLLQEHVDFDPSGVSQSFKIAASDFFAVMLMPPLAEILSRRAPHMQVQMVDLLPASYVGILERPGIDLALVPQTDFPSWSAHQPLFQSRFVMIARSSHPRLERSGVASGTVVPIDLFCDLGHVVFSPEGNLTAMGDAALARIGRARRVVMTLPVFSGVCIAVAGSDLVALVPEQLALRLAPQLGLSLFQPPMPLNAATICMLWHKRSTGTAAHRWFRTVVAEVLGALK